MKGPLYYTKHRIPFDPYKHLRNEVQSRCWRSTHWKVRSVTTNKRFTGVVVPVPTRGEWTSRFWVHHHQGLSVFTLRNRLFSHLFGEMTSHNVFLLSRHSGDSVWRRRCARHRDGRANHGLESDGIDRDEVVHWIEGVWSFCERRRPEEGKYGFVKGFWADMFWSWFWFIFALSLFGKTTRGRQPRLW